MQRTICLKLQTTHEQDIALSRTLAASRECFNAVTAYGWDNKTKNGVTLHNATYYALRGQHTELPSQLVISARMKATEALKAAFTLKNKYAKDRKPKPVTCPHTEHGSIRYDARSYRMGHGEVGLSTVAGRIKAAFTVPAHAKRWMDRAIGFASADLVRRPSGWWLNVVLKIPDIVSTPNGKVVGVDLGINRPAVTSEGVFLGQKRWKETENRYFRLKRKLSAKGTKSAKRHLKKLSRKQGRFRKDCDHVLSKRIVQNLEPGTIVAIENLKDIRSRTKQRGRKQRRRHHGWSYAQLRAFLTYKAEEKGCTVFAVDPRKTSQRCWQCGHVHKRNRPTQSVFHCRECGYEVNADYNAARNIAWKYLAENGMSVLCWLSSISQSWQTGNGLAASPAL